MKKEKNHRIHSRIKEIIEKDKIAYWLYEDCIKNNPDIYQIEDRISNASHKYEYE